MLKSICKRAIGLASRQAIASGADIVRRGLGVLMLLVTASVMLNLATPGAARAGPGSVSFTASLSDTSIQAGETTILTFEITNAGPAFQAFLGIGTGSFANTAYALPAGVVVGSSGVTSNTCSLDFAPGQTATAGAAGFRIGDFLDLPATCTVSIQITAASAGTYHFGDAISYVGDVPGTDVVGTITIPGPLTVTAAPPTPVLTFATPTSASVTLGGSLTNAATSTITGGGAGAITYSSSNTNVATVNTSTGAVTTVAAGTATITATQAAAAGVNAAASQTYQLTVTPAAPTVTGVSPNIGNGFQGGGFAGTTVVITGTGFSVGTPTVYFGGLGVSSETIQSDTQMTVTPPNGFHTGTVDVTVVTTNGTSATSSADQFTYAPLPTISAVTPSSGPTSTSTPMTITGTGFTGATRVFVANGTVVFTVVSDTEITTTSPPVGVALTFDVIVEGRGGWATATGGYRYVDPAPVLGVTMTHTGSAYKGSTFTYVITPSATVANTSGTLTATWSLPSGLSFSSASGTGWTCDSTQCTSTSAIGAGSNGNPITLTVSVDANATSPLTPSVTLSGGGATSSVTANDSGTTILTPAAPTIAVSTTSFPGAIAVGGTTQLTFTLTNPNPTTITGVAVSLSLPSGLVINQSSGGQFVNNCTNGSLSGATGGTSVSLTGARINANSACTFTVVVRGTSAGSPVVATGTPSATAASAGAAGTSLTLTVNAALTTTQAVASADLTQNVAATAFTPVTASGGVGPLSYGLSGGSLPSGLSFSSSTGQITGTPAGLQSATTYTVTVTDASIPTALTSSKTFDLSVSAAPDPTPVLTFATPTAASVAHGGSLTNAATSTISGGGAGAITYSSSDEAVATVNEATGAITTVGVGAATITATQAAVGGVNAEATTTYELTVNAGPMEVSESVSPSSTVAPGESVALTLTITNNTGADWQTGDLAQFDLIIPNSAFQASVGGPTSNNCGGFQAINATNFQRLYGFVVANGASCTVVFHLTAAGAPGESSTVQISFKPNNTATPEVHSTQLTVGTPTPTLTFATSTSASVAHGGSLTNAATSTMTGGGAGAITYSSSNTGVATVNAATGAITTLAVGTTTITATQAAASGVNASAAQTYVLTVTVGAGSTSSATLSASTVVVGGTVDLTITVTNNSGVDVVAGDGVLLTASLANGWVSYGLGGAISNTCGGSLTASSVYGKSLTGVQAANGATCTVVYRLTATSASATPESIIVGLNPAYTALNLATHTLPLTITPPVPVLTFATPTAASVTLGGSLTNAATSTVTGGDAGAITYSSSNTSVATVNASTGAITTVAVGTATITATQASNATTNAAASRTYLLTVTAPAPAITTASLPAWTVLKSGYSQTVAVTGGLAPVSLAVTSGSLPSGLTLNSATGVISGTPDSAGATPFGFTVTATDSLGQVASRTLAITINSIVYVNPGVLPNGVRSLPYSQAIEGLGGTGSLALTLSGGSLPAGLALNSEAGLLVGTPTATGTYSFTLTATDSVGAAGSRAYTLIIEAGLPIVGPVSLTVAQNSIDNPVALVISGGAATGVTVTTGPAHGSVTVAGTTITYTPTAGYYGADSFAYIATGPAGASAPATVSLTVNAPTLAITPEALPSAEQSIAYSQSLSAGGGAAPYSFTVAGGALPPGLSLSSVGLISGAPTEQGTYAFTVRAQDSSTGSGPAATTRDYSLTVAVAPPPVAEAVQVSVTIDATDDTNAGMTAIDLSAAVSNASGVIIITGPVHGTLTVSGFTVTYTPNPGYYGPDSFIYRAVGLPGSAANQASAGIQGASRSSAGPTPGLSPPATVSITVTSPLLTMSPGATASASVGAAFSQTFAAAGGTAPYHDYRVESGALPAGLTLSADGRLTGMPTAAGTFAFVIAATDSSTGDGPFIASREYSLTVGAPALTLSPGVLSDGLQGASYSPVTFAGQGGTAPYSFGLSAGSLPTGMTLSSAGLLFGTPIQSGHFNFTVRTTDSSTGSGPFSSDQALTLDIGVPAAPTASAGTLASPYNSAGVEIDVAALVSGAYGSVELTTGPAHGSVVRSGTRFTYTPTAGYYGPDSFSYTAVGFGGPSTPAAVSVTVATPAPVTTPKSATTPANASVDIAVTTGDSGPIASIAISQPPSHGEAVIDGLSVTYTPTTNYFGADSFSYTATGAGGTSSPTVVSLTVSALPVPTSPARTASVLAGQSVVLDATDVATGGPFTAVALSDAPAIGTATVSGQQITYAAPSSFSGATSFTYVLSNPFGTSAPVTVTITVNPLPAAGAPITVTVPADGSGSAVLTAGATGGPFQSAAVVSLSPAGSGTVSIHQGAGPSGPTFALTFTAAVHFSGSATVSYTLTNAFATSAPGTVIFQVEARPDPTLDPDVRGLVIAQVDTTVRFAMTQIDNFNRRLESLRNGPGRSDLDGVNLNFGDLFYRGDQSDPFALRDRQLGRQDADVAPRGVRPALPVETVGGFKAAGDGGSGGDAAGGVSVWTGGTIDLGLRRGKAGLSKLNFTTQGVSLGADFSLGDDWAIGAGTGYSSDNTKIGTDGSRSKATSYVGVFYGAYHPSDRTYLEMVFGYGEVSFESRRYVPVNGLIAYGERDGSQVFASATAAFAQRDGALTWTPYGRLTAVSAKLDAFTETGGGIGSLTFHGQDIRSLKGVAGLTSDYTTWTRHGVLTPSLRLEYAYEFEDRATYSLSYADWVDGPVFSAPTGVRARGQLTIGLGADLQRGPLRLGLEYRGGLGDDEATTNQVSAKASLKF